MDTIHHHLKQFEPISLEEMDGVKLMDRTDTKFVVKIDDFKKLLPALMPDYRVLEIDLIRSSQYETLYFDTDHFNLYINHQNKKLNRYKIRIRNYVESNLFFLEIKFKNNKGRTIKKRIKIPQLLDELTPEVKDFIRNVSNINPDLLKPKIWVNYSRTTLVGKHSNERVTIDTDLNFENNGIKKSFKDLVIIEVKQEKAKSSPIIELLQRHKIKQGSLSKYCLGIVTTVQGIKMNNFKEKIRSLNKIVYATSIQETT